MITVDRFVITGPFYESWNSEEMLAGKQSCDNSKNKCCNWAESIHVIFEIQGRSQLREQKNVDQIASKGVQLVDWLNRQRKIRGDNWEQDDVDFQ